MTIPTRHQNKQRTGRVIRHQANWRHMADSTRYSFPVSVRLACQKAVQ